MTSGDPEIGRIVATGEGGPNVRAAIFQIAHMSYVAVVDVSGTPAMLWGSDRGLLMCDVDIAFKPMLWRVRRDGE